MVQPCGGSVSVTGAVHSRAYLHSNKPKASLAEKVILPTHSVKELHEDSRASKHI